MTIRLDPFRITSDNASVGLIARSDGAKRWTMYLDHPAAKARDDHAAARPVLCGRSLTMEQAVRAVQLAELAAQPDAEPAQWLSASSWAAELGLSVHQALPLLGIDATIPEDAHGVVAVGPAPQKPRRWWRR